MILVGFFAFGARFACAALCKRRGWSNGQTAWAVGLAKCQHHTCPPYVNTWYI